MNEHLKGLPDAVARQVTLASAQRAAYTSNPDPLTVVEAEPEEPALDLSPEEKLEECAAEPETDIGNARRLIIRYGDVIRYVQNVGWHAYVGGRWKEDVGDVIVRRHAQKTAEFIDDEAILLDCSDEEKAAIEAGRVALADLKAMGRATKEWTVEQTEKHEALQRIVDKMARVNKDRDGRMSSRHGHAKSAAGTSKINNMLTETAVHVSLEVDQLNRDLMAVNCKSGTLRFFKGPVPAKPQGQAPAAPRGAPRPEGSEVGAREDETKQQWQVRLDRHDPRDLISKCAEVELVTDAACPRFEQFFRQVMPDVDLRAFIQRFAGYCLLGLTGEQCLLFFYGAGRNGKSTFVDILTDILGDYAVSMSIDSFAGDTRRGGAEATPDLARLPGARLVAASEPEMGVKLKDALIKTLTGGEAIAVRRLHQDFFELEPQFKLMISGNHKPVIHDDSDGIWRRVHLVPWEVQIPEADVDIDLKRKLLTERDGIFAWMIRGALDYLENGLKVPARVSQATAEYREENDPIGAFLRNGCDITGRDEDQVSPRDLFDAYCIFARREGLAEFKQATFSKRLPDQTRKTFKGSDGLQHMFRKGKSGTTVYYGIRVKDAYRTTDDRSPPPYGGYDEPLPADF